MRVCASFLPVLAVLATALWPVTGVSRTAAKPSEQKPAAGMLLVAKRDMLSPSFTQTVILLIRHDANGALGVILNRRTRLTLKDVLPELDQSEAVRHTLFLGGPVAPQSVLLLMRKESVVDGVESVQGDITVSAQAGVMHALIERKKSPDDLRVFIGYAGWAGGQLEGELARGAWRLTSATAEVVFGGTTNMWERLIERLDPPGIRVYETPNVGVAARDDALQRAD